MALASSTPLLRPAAVAGRFYPGDEATLRRDVAGYIAGAGSVAGKARPKAIIAPHAGYIYSGPTAGFAYAAIQHLRGSVERVVLISPSHYVNFTGIAASAAAAFATPLGLVPVDRAAVAAAQRLPFVRPLEEAHQREHGLEVHLPFLQETLGEFKLVPFAHGDVSYEHVGQLLELLWGGPQTLIVISSDLSHYLDYDAARAMDLATCRSIEAMQPHEISPPQACGRLAIQGLLAVAPWRGLRVRTLDLRNSGDTAGDRSRVVGYGAWVLE